MGADRDDVRLGVVGEDHGAEVVHGVGGGLKERGDELVEGGRAGRLDQERNQRKTW